MNAPRVEDVIAGGYKSVVSWAVVLAQIQLRIKARRCAAKLVVLMNLSGRSCLKLNNFFLETFVGRSSFFLLI